MTSALLLGVFAAEAWLCRAFLERRWRGSGAGDVAVRIALSFGLWAGLLSAGTYLARRFDLSGGAVWVGHAAVLALFGGVVWWARRWAALPPRPGASAVDPPRWLGRLLAGCAVAAVLAALAGGALFVAHNPSGGYDAWWMWNTKARLLHLHDGPWSALVETMAGHGHPDYPLLLPGSVAAGLDLVGADTIVVPIAVTAAFWGATVALVAGALASERSWTVACVACVCLCADRDFVASAFDQTADVPLGFCVVAAVTLFRRAAATGDRALCALGGAFLGWATWTKNEGGLVFATFLAAGALVYVRRRTLRAAGGGLLLLLVGAAPMLLLTFSYKSAIPVANDLVRGWTAGTLRHLADPARWAAVLRAFAFEVRHWAGAVVLLLLALVVASLWTWRFPRAADRAWKWCALSVLLVLGGYVLVFVTSPWPDLEWHLRSALTRLLAQLWPAFLVLALARIDGRLILPGAERDGRARVEGKAR